MAHVGLERVQHRIGEACDRAGRPREDVTLVVVSKNRSDDDVMAVYDAGQRVFAENREQGLRARMGSDLPDDIQWHFVGPLQSRKAAYVGEHVTLLHSMDRLRLANKWTSNTDAPVLIQFNLGEEPQKSGFAPNEADEAFAGLQSLGVAVVGVMAIPPQREDPEDVRPFFAQLRDIRDRLGSTDPAVDVCSMGMTNDLEIAIEEGATMVRVGRAIFA
ncbi:MAG: YggS family pyridoxal phosphate-dependent enzyme [Acidimicrobiia bacterium]